jgi:bifunctional UDP-N-acetylglucosamine pyrophosphorylase/glucosamine-1-phosphate N-acetyltransferase
MNRPLAAIILAAGKGTRMRSDLPKVMHPLAHRPLISHVLASVAELQPSRTLAVIAPDQQVTAKHLAAQHPTVEIAHQTEQRGTGDAVRATETTLGNGTDLLVLFGDTPLVSSRTMHQVVECLRGTTQPAVVVVGIRLSNPTGYGRLVQNTSGTLERIVEEKDATPEERRITLCNSGMMALSGEHGFALLAQLQPTNAQGEYYLTDAVALARAAGLRVEVVEADAGEMLGINSRAQLAEVEQLFQTRLRHQAMANGVTLIDPASVFLAADTQFGTDVTIHPFVVIGPRVTIGNQVEVRSFSHLEGAEIGHQAIIGPFARLRPGAQLADSVHIGNFVEVKNAKLAEGVKANHLSYIGDASIGARSNIGAGTITCNYDGYRKSQTTIGEEVFVGSNSALVAPVTIGNRAIIAAGSTITDDVAEDALTLARTRQHSIPGWAARFREKMR